MQAVGTTHSLITDLALSVVVDGVHGSLLLFENDPVNVREYGDLACLR